MGLCRIYLVRRHAEGERCENRDRRYGEGNYGRGNHYYAQPQSGLPNPLRNFKNLLLLEADLASVLPADNCFNEQSYESILQRFVREGEFIKFHRSGLKSFYLLSIILIIQSYPILSK